MTDSFEQISAHNEELARDIVERASARGVTVSTAESLTAGMIASTIADIPGASAVLRGGAVTYCDEIKHFLYWLGASFRRWGRAGRGLCALPL